ncbi:hypothetical protein ACX80V_08445 [Arthrobacter sp. MDT3-24]
MDGPAAIVNHSEVAILGLGRIIDKPWMLMGRAQSLVADPHV